MTYSLEFIASTGSTNADLLARLAEGARGTQRTACASAEGAGIAHTARTPFTPFAEGDWLIADRQTAGRGRLGRVWDDGIGNFMGSTLAEVRPDDPPLHSLALIAAIALIRCLRKVAPDLPAMVKWPNDILVDGAKLAGILLERSANHVVIGIGVNLVTAPKVTERRTCALGQYMMPPPRDAFAFSLAKAMEMELARWHNVPLSSHIDAWMVAAHPLGTALRVSETGKTGFFDGLESDGALRLREQDGTIAVIRAGDVALNVGGRTLARSESNTAV